MSKPNPDQELISREELQARLDAVLSRCSDCQGYRIEAIQLFPPGLIEHSNWRIAPPLDANGVRDRSPCWQAIHQEVRQLQRRYKLPWP